jgi:hypothetical protein
MTTVSYQPAHKELTGDDTWERVTYKIARSPLVQRLGVNYTDYLPDRIFDQTLGFLLCCGRKTAGEGAFSATPYIDEGWHYFLLHLRQYLKFCDDQFGKTIWHNPYHPVLDFDAETNMRAGCLRAKAAMVQHGFHVDEVIWNLPYSDSSSGECDDACSYAYLD